MLFLLSLTVHVLIYILQYDLESCVSIQFQRKKKNKRKKKKIEKQKTKENGTLGQRLHFIFSAQC
ncbi:putative signal peptide protein [Puccinia sorghi]|uniref:Putative signal peptide protein n=1 Tax=Puccinia sorghi TaxID=27349 RepID=A0A0L6U5T2_9BASI|nr:putative signal peptide protein [Puccinia sorghi]